jgi:class 3 adenylate cyclase
MAFRLCAEAEAGGILVSGLVHKLSGQDASRFVALGERRLKGFPARTPVFRFEWRS